MANASGAEIGKLGCLNSDVSGRMTLFFGAPTDVNNNFGVTLWGGANQTVSQVGELVKEFVRGYVWCRKGGQQILIGVGTSNSGADTKSNEWMAAHGHAWAQMVKAVGAWVDATYPGIARIFGAWDGEPSWSNFFKADMWLQGYNGVPGNRTLHAHVSADGCPQNNSDDGWCNNGWRQGHVWHVAWRFDPSLPMPQIYATSGANARQWQRIDEWGARFRSDGIFFTGLMTQYGACLQRGGCNKTDNMPHMGHDQLLGSLNANGLTAQGSVESVTDIYWHS